MKFHPLGGREVGFSPVHVPSMLAVGSLSWRAFAMKAIQVLLFISLGQASGIACLGFEISGPPVIIYQPTNVVIHVGGTAEFYVSVGGSRPVEYQWLYEGRPITRATNRTLVLPSVTFDQRGEYQVAAWNMDGAALSAPASLAVVNVLSLGQVTVAGDLTNAVAITSGVAHIAALRGDGTVRTWGYFPYGVPDLRFGQTNVPPGLSNVVAIDAGAFHTLALRSDGTVVAWGAQDDPAADPVDFGQADVPPGLTHVMAILATDRQSVALKQNGTLVIWGESLTNVPIAATNLVAISEWNQKFVGVRSDGSVVVWDEEGLDRDPWVHDLADAVTVEGPVVLRNDGSVYFWGTWRGHEIVPGNTSEKAVEVSADSRSGSDNLILRSDGTVLDASGGFVFHSGDLTNVVALDASHELAVLGDGSPTPVELPVWRHLYHGETIVLYARAVGAPPLSYQWFFNGKPLAGATNVNLAVNDAGFESAGSYAFRVSNRLGSVVATNTQLRVHDSAPVVTVQSTNLVTYPGASSFLEVSAEGSLPLTYQWYFDGAEIPGATNRVLTLDPVRFEDVGSYRVRVENGLGATVSSNATVEIPAVIPWGYYIEPIPNSFGYDAFVPDDLAFRHDVVQISTKYYHTLALTSDGAVHAWGRGVYAEGVTNLPPELPPADAVAAGDRSSAILLSDGTAITRQNYSDAGWIEAPATNVIAVSDGFPGFLGLRADREVVPLSLSTNAPPPEVHDVVALSANHLFPALALRSDGTVVAWSPFEAQLSYTDLTQVLTNVVAVAADDFRYVVLHADGTVTAWDIHGELLRPPDEATNIVAIVAEGAALGLRADGTIVSWDQVDPLSYSWCLCYPPGGLNHVVDFATGAEHGFAMVGPESLVRFNDLKLGRLRWFSDTPSTWFGQTEERIDGGEAARSGIISDGERSNLRTRVMGPGFLSFYWKVSSEAGGDHLRFLRNGAEEARISGESGWRQEIVPLPEGYQSLEWAYEKDAAGAAGWDAGWLDRVEFFPRGRLPAEMPAPLPDQNVWRGTTAVFSARPTGVEPFQFQWRFNGIDLPGETNQTLRVTNVQAADAGAYSVRVGNAYGSDVSQPAVLTVMNGPPEFTMLPGNSVAYLGERVMLSVTIAGSRPLKIQWEHDGVPLAGGTNETLTLDHAELQDSGAYVVMVTNALGAAVSRHLNLEVVPVVVWGDDTQAQGNLPPTNLAAFREAVAVTAGSFQNLVLRRDGQVLVWGQNQPAQPPAGLTNIVAVALGASVGAALRADGRVDLWGLAGSFTVGNDITDIAAGSSHALGVLRDGTVAAWAVDPFRQLDVPSNLRRVVAIGAEQDYNLALHDDGSVSAWGTGPATNVPPSLGGVVRIAAGRYHALALLKDGSVVAWGNNSYGETNVPADLREVVAIAAGDNHSVALQADGTVRVWGRNDAHQREVPIGLSNVVAIAAGGQHAIALLSDESPPAPLGAVPRIEDVRFGADGFRVRVPTLIGRVYRLEYTDTLEPPRWHVLPMILGDGTVRELEDTTGHGGSRFYRVWQGP